MRKEAERAGCGQRPPGGKSGGDLDGICGGGGSVMGGCGRRRVSDVGGPAPVVGSFLLSALGLSLSMRCIFCLPTAYIFTFFVNLN